MDFFGTTHSVTVSDHQHLKVYFPIVSGDWWWLDAEGWERTGFNDACKWVQADFLGMPGGWFEDPYVKIGARCFKNQGEPDADSLMTEIK